MKTKKKKTGSVHSSFNGWVGIPLNYFYKSALDIDRMNLTVRNQPINWNSKYGELLEKSLVLTDDEKLFGITKTVLELRNYNYVHAALIPSFTIFGLYCSAQMLNQRYNLFQIPKTVSVDMSVVNGRRLWTPFLFTFNTIFAIGPRHGLWSVVIFCVWNLFGGYRFDKNQPDHQDWHRSGRTWSR